jgi:type IV secretory pathway TrbF-like protein
MASTKKNPNLKQEITANQLTDLLKEQNLITVENNRYFLTNGGKFLFEQNAENRKEVINPYLAGRQEWDDRNGSLIAQISNLWKALIGALIIIALLVGGLISVARQSKVIPYYIGLDKLLNGYPLGVPQDVKLSDGMIERQLMNYIEALRSFSSDPNINTKNIQVISSMSSQSLSDQIDTIVKANAADQNLSSITVAVTGINSYPNSDNSYEINWTENRKASDGTSIQTYWKANITYKKLELTDTSILQNNPFGVLITSLQIFPRLVSNTGAQ